MTVKFAYAAANLATKNHLTPADEKDDERMMIFFMISHKNNGKN